MLSRGKKKSFIWIGVRVVGEITSLYVTDAWLVFVSLKCIVHKL